MGVFNPSASFLNGALLLMVLVGGPVWASPPGDRGVRRTHNEPVLTPEQELTLTRVNELLNQLLDQIYKYGQRKKEKQKPPRRTAPAPDINPRFGLDRPTPPPTNSVNVLATSTDNP